MPLHLREKVHALCHGEPEKLEVSSQHANQPPGPRSIPARLLERSHHPILPLLSIEELWDGEPQIEGQYPVYQPPKDDVDRGIMTRKAAGIRHQLALPLLPGDPERSKGETEATESRNASEREWWAMFMMDDLEGVWRSDNYRRRQIKIIKEREKDRIEYEKKRKM